MVMPRKYPGYLVNNKRWRKRQHYVAPYYKYGLDLGIYSDSMDLIVNELVKRIKGNYQNIIHFSGDPGSGKSTCCIQMMKRLAKALKIELDIPTDYIYTSDDMWNKLKNHPTPIFFFDEASVTLNSLSYRGTDDRDILSIIETMRSKHHNIFLVSPTIGNINAKVRREYVDFRVECASDKTPLRYGSTAYGRGIFEFKERIPPKKDGDEPNWNLLTTGTFDELDPETNAIYQEVKSKHQDVLIERVIKRNMKQYEEIET